jgi:hypothetical protein
MAIFNVGNRIIEPGTWPWGYSGAKGLVWDSFVRDGSIEALYLLNGDIKDETGEHSGELHGLYFEIDGKGQCLVADNSDGWADLFVADYSQPFSVSLWGQGAFNLTNERFGAVYGTMNISNSGILMRRKNNIESGASGIAFEYDFLAGFLNFRHILVACEYPELNVYLDGAPFYGTMNFPVAPSEKSTGLFDISRKDLSASKNYTGKINEVAFFNRKLSDGEALKIFAAGRG